MSVAAFIHDSHHATIRASYSTLKMIGVDMTFSPYKYKQSYLTNIKKGWYEVVGFSNDELLSNLYAIKNAAYSTEMPFVHASRKTLEEIGFTEINKDRYRKNRLVLIHNTRGLWYAIHTDHYDRFIQSEITNIIPFKQHG